MSINEKISYKSNKYYVYAKDISMNVLLPALIDFLASTVLISILYGIGLLSFRLFLKSAGISVNYIKIPIGILGVLYAFSILVVSIGRHIRFVNTETINSNLIDG